VRQRTSALVRQAQRDHLTGLPNRALLEERLERSVEAAKRHGRRLALLFLDLDGFKSVNDTYGHDAGDDMLQQIGDRLASCLVPLEAGGQEPRHLPRQRLTRRGVRPAGHLGHSALVDTASLWVLNRRSP
jgi:GAF domain-containing protein